MTASTSGKVQTLIRFDLQHDIAMKPDFTIGDRVRMTARGASRCIRLADRMGTIVGRSIYANSVSVRFDGILFHFGPDYLEMIVKADLVPMLARIGVMKTPHRHEVRQFNLNRKDIHWGSGSRRGINKDSAPLVIGLDAVQNGRLAKLGLRR